MSRSFYDDYEEDCIKIWDAIEKLQRELQLIVRRLSEIKVEA